VILYVDTSAVVKALLLEVGSTDVERWYARADEVAASVITYAEACAALGHSARMHGSDSATLAASVATLEAQWDEFFVLPVPEREAGQAALRHGLRGMDAVQLATALELRALASAQAPGVEVVVASYDRRLLEAAEREGFATLGGPLTT
jgi:predicted nucleic acid-binding protein